MKLYLYLTRKEWANAWIEGGKIPLNLASMYLSDERSETKTPDENNQRELKNLSEEQLAILGNMDSVPTTGKNTFNISIGKMTVGDKVIAENIEYKRHYEDGYILSFSTKFDKEIMRNLGKNCCVQICDHNKLFEELNKQMIASLDLYGVQKVCEYTKGKNRNVFLKSIEDEWQQEYRFYWKVDHKETNDQSIELSISANTAKLIE